MQPQSLSVPERVRLPDAVEYPTNGRRRSLTSTHIHSVVSIYRRDRCYIGHSYCRKDTVIQGTFRRMTSSVAVLTAIVTTVVVADYPIRQHFAYEESVATGPH